MDSELSRILADCIADMERGAGVGDCLKRNPANAAELRPHLEAWAGMGSLPLVQPPAAAFDRGREAMLGALKPAPMGFGPLSRIRLAPAWATVPAAAAAVVILLGGAAGTSAALGGPDPASQVLSVVGVGRNDGGSSNSAVNACPSATPVATPQGAEGTEVDGEFCDENRGHGNDPDHDDEDNPGQGQGNHGADDPAGTADEGDDANRGHGNDPANDDPDNPGEGQGNHGTGNNGNGQENPDGNANAGDPPANGTGGNPAGSGNSENPPQGNENGQHKPKD